MLQDPKYCSTEERMYVVCDYPHCGWEQRIYLSEGNYQCLFIKHFNEYHANTDDVIAHE
jgi:hypothetical protein